VLAVRPSQQRQQGGATQGHKRPTLTKEMQDPPPPPVSSLHPHLVLEVGLGAPPRALAAMVAMRSSITEVLAEYSGHTHWWQGLEGWLQTVPTHAPLSTCHPHSTQHTQHTHHTQHRTHRENSAHSTLGEGKGLRGREAAVRVTGGRVGVGAVLVWTVCGMRRGHAGFEVPAAWG